MIAGVILCGGRSSRMGQDKAKLLWQGKTWLQHMADLLREAGVDDVIVSGDYPGFETVIDPIPGKGPTMGVIASILALSERFDQMICAPVDMPLMPALILKTLIEGKGDGRFYEDHPLPFALELTDQVRICALQALDDIRQGRNYSIRRFFRPFDMMIMPMAPASFPFFQNLNSPEDIEKVCATPTALLSAPCQNYGKPD